MFIRFAIFCLMLLVFGVLLGGCTSTPARRTDASSAVALEAVPPPDRHVVASVKGRPIRAVTVRSGSPRLLIIGGIHGDEREGGRWIDELAAKLAVSPTTVGVRIIADINPDGTAANTRTNSQGVDLNRNFPSRNFKPSAVRGKSAGSEPETAALINELNTYKPDVVIVLHSAGSGPFVNYDGPAADLAAAFATAAASEDPRWRIMAQMGYPTPGSLGSFVGVDRSIPILTIEFARGRESVSARDALFTGTDAVLRAMSDRQRVATKR